MQIRRAVIPTAGLGTRHYPASSVLKKAFFPLVDSDGFSKPVIHLIVEEALESGIEEICIITSPGDDKPFRQYFKAIPRGDLQAYSKINGVTEMSETLADMGDRITYVTQSVQEGFGHAVHCARDFAGDEPVLVMLGDHIYTSDNLFIHQTT
jgi:UTP--glucose-1-phosphate uridylyltransferase